MKRTKENWKGSKGKGSSEVGKSCVRTGILGLVLILLSACAASGNSGVQESGSVPSEGQASGVSPETMPEGKVSDAPLGSVAEGGGESDRTEPPQDQAAGRQEALPGEDARTEAEEETSEEEPASEPAASLAAYRQTIEESDAGMVFSLIYLDGDEVPELVAGDRGNDRYSIYTIKDGAVLCLVDFRAAAELSYFGHSGIVAVFASWNGGGDEGGYGRQYYQTFAGKTLADGDVPLLSYSYNAVYDADGVYTGEGVTDYFHMGQEIEEPEYDKILEALGITADGGRLCLENAVLAEEMLDALK